LFGDNLGPFFRFLTEELFLEPGKLDFEHLNPLLQGVSPIFLGSVFSRKRSNNSLRMTWMKID
jgi:hypothetical protein